jgi:hypothetical protein
MLLVIKTAAEPGAIQLAVAEARKHGASNIRAKYLGKGSQLFASPPGSAGCILIEPDHVCLSADMEYISAAEWFAEAPFEAPYPPGALLWFRD